MFYAVVGEGLEAAAQPLSGITGLLVDGFEHGADLGYVLVEQGTARRAPACPRRTRRSLRPPWRQAVDDARPRRETPTRA